LAGATQRSDSDPYDKTSPPITVGPHWMIMWPFDPKATGLPTMHKPTGPYILWAGSPYAHVHVIGSIAIWNTGPGFLMVWNGPLLQRLSVSAGSLLQRHKNRTGLDSAKHVFQVRDAEVGEEPCSQAAAR
jgi:hypothetical protein